MEVSERLKAKMGSHEIQSPEEKQCLVVNPEPRVLQNNGRRTFCRLLREPFDWLSMLCRELETSFILAIIVVYGFSQGFSGSFFKVVTDYYWKDVQQVQPSVVQLYQGLYVMPWIMKPIWGLLTDVFSIAGYKRRPYFVLAGTLGSFCALLLLQKKPPVLFALIFLTGISAAMSIADVTIDACIARSSIQQPALASDMQSLCGFVSSTGAILGYSTSGMLVHTLGAQGALGLLALPLTMIITLGFTMTEAKSMIRTDKKAPFFLGCCSKAALHYTLILSSILAMLEAKGIYSIWMFAKVNGAVLDMIKTMKYPGVWKPSLFMYLSITLSISTHEGQFYWYTDPKAGPAFPKEFVGVIYAVGAVGSIVGVILYHKFLREFPFRTVIFFAQLLYGVSGMLDLMFVLRLNLKLGVPDYVFVIMEEMCARIISRIRWMPMIILSTRLCPLGIEGTFFALLMCIDSTGSLSSKWGGSLVLQLLKVTRTDFRNLWLALLIRNLLRISTLALIFLVPKAGPADAMLPDEMLDTSRNDADKEEGLQLVCP